VLVAHREPWRWRHGQDESSHDCKVEKRCLTSMRQDGQVLYLARHLICHFFRCFLEVGIGSSRPEARDFDKDSTSWPEFTYKALGIVLGNLTSLYGYLTKISRRFPYIAALIAAEVLNDKSLLSQQ